MCFYDMKARYKASLLTATRKLENIFWWWAADWQSNGRVLDPVCLVCFHGFFVLLFYMSSVSVTQNKCPNSITAILSTYLIHEFLVNVKCRMDGSHRKPFICLSFDFLVQYSANGTCLLNFGEYARICRPPSGFFARVTLISLAYTETP